MVDWGTELDAHIVASAEEGSVFGDEGSTDLGRLSGLGKGCGVDERLHTGIPPSV